MPCFNVLDKEAFKAITSSFKQICPSHGALGEWHKDSHQNIQESFYQWNMHKTDEEFLFQLFSSYLKNKICSISFLYPDLTYPNWPMKCSKESTILAKIHEHLLGARQSFMNQVKHAPHGTQSDTLAKEHYHCYKFSVPEIKRYQISGSSIAWYWRKQKPNKRLKKNNSKDKAQHHMNTLKELVKIFKEKMTESS